MKGEISIFIIFHEYFMNTLSFIVFWSLICLYLLLSLRRIYRCSAAVLCVKRVLFIIYLELSLNEIVLLQCDQRIQLVHDKK